MGSRDPLGRQCKMIPIVLLIHLFIHYSLKFPPSEQELWGRVGCRAGHSSCSPSPSAVTTAAISSSPLPLEGRAITSLHQGGQVEQCSFWSPKSFKMSLAALQKSCQSAQPAAAPGLVRQQFRSARPDSTHSKHIHSGLMEVPGLLWQRLCRINKAPIVADDSAFNCMWIQDRIKVSSFVLLF